MTLSHPFESPQDDPLAHSPVYAKLRRDEPVARVTLRQSGLEAWLVTRYDDVRTVLKAPCFSRAAANDIPGYPDLSTLVIGMDGAERARIRGVAQRALTPARAAALRPRIERVADTLLDALIAAGEPGDLVGGLALPLTVTVIGDLLGVPPEDRAPFAAWGDSFLSTSGQSLEESTAAQRSMAEFFGDLIAERRARPAGDLISELIARDDGASLSAAELTNLAMVIMVAGFETTASAITNFVYWLLVNDTYGRVRDVPPAVEELLRTLPLGVADALPRRAVADTELGGVTIRAGDIVIPAHDSANHDLAVFDVPDRVDLERRANPHLSFGHGPHFCLGAHLARAEMQVVLDRLTSRMPRLRLAVRPDELPWKTGVAVRGLTAMPVRWG